jgi:hypothetical protein
MVSFAIYMADYDQDMYAKGAIALEGSLAILACGAAIARSLAHLEDNARFVRQLITSEEANSLESSTPRRSPNWVNDVTKEILRIDRYMGFPSYDCSNDRLEQYSSALSWKLYSYWEVADYGRSP